MPYDYDPYRRDSNQRDTYRSGGSSRYDSSSRRNGSNDRTRSGQRSRSSSRSNGTYRNGNRMHNGGYSRSSSGTRTQSRSGRTRSRQGDRTNTEARRRSRNLQMPDTGYSLHSRRVRGSNGSLSHRLGMFDGRVVVLGALLVLVVVVLVTSISSCIRNANSSSTENTKQMSSADSRVAAGVSDSMVSEFSTQLDRNEKLAQIAANADQYDDDRLLQLALDEPTAISFVAGYPTAEKTTSGYNQTVSIGNPPLLYDWNTAWGYAEYDDGCIAVTGSEPTTLSMAYMGLTGNTDQTPVGAARALNSAASSATTSSSTDDSDSTDGTSTSTSSSSSSTGTPTTGSTDADTFCAAAESLGLTPTVMNITSSTSADDSSSSTSTTTTTTTTAQKLTAALQEGALVAVKIKSQTLTSSEHWALVVNANADGSVTVYDPTSSSVSSHTWGAGTIASSASEMISLVAAKSQQNNADDGTSTSSTGGDSTTSANTSNSTTASTGASSTTTDSSSTGTQSATSGSTSTGSNAAGSNASTSGSGATGTATASNAASGTSNTASSNG